jgi:hypothetical protein
MSTDFIHVPRIYNTLLHDVFYDTRNKNFILRRPIKKTRPVNDTMLVETPEYRDRPIKWKQLVVNYTNKKGVERTYRYRFVLIPQDGKYVRVKEGELEKYLRGE